jgi:hypothetical protein
VLSDLLILEAMLRHKTRQVVDALVDVVGESIQEWALPGVPSHWPDTLF